MILEIRNQHQPGVQATSITCSLTTSRLGPKKINELTIYGSRGTLVASNEAVFLISDQGQVLRTGSCEAALGDQGFDGMLKSFHAEICLGTSSCQYSKFAKQDTLVTKTVEMIYGFQGSDASSAFEPLALQWPRITKDLEQDAVAQLHRDISIYDNKGILGEFETAFKQVHRKSNWYALLHNSGTNALQALYYGTDFKSGDEIIFPVYTFHATVSPAMLFGITPIFCDAGLDGNISVEAIAKAITPRTKAVVVTHMWGVPCDMKGIVSLLANSPGILLLEDCSHAHGASQEDQFVGTFGDGAAWSLQGQKVITGGEGGIVLTKQAEFHYRQLIWGHYNKRCKLEIPAGHLLQPYALTGAGSKNRAHPIAVAIALNQLRKLGSFLTTKSKFAERIAEGLGGITFLEVPDVRSLGKKRVCPAWYAFIIMFNPNKAPKGLSRERFVRELLNRGLLDVDIPKSTGLLHDEPLFTAPEIVLPHIYRTGQLRSSGSVQKFPQAQSFYDRAIKLPVWAYEDEMHILDRYVKQICLAAELFTRHS